jgi:hypothetical protein
MLLTTSLLLDNGIELNNSFAMISSCLIKYSNPLSLIISVNIFKDYKIYLLEKPEVIQLTYTITNPIYDQYFSEELLNLDSKTVLSQCEQLLIDKYNYSIMQL